MGHEWVECQLGKHCEILSAKRIFASDYVDNGIPFYRSKEIIEKAAGQNVSNQLFISEKRFLDIKNKFGAPKSGDLLISAVGQRAGIPYHVSNDGDFYFKDGNLIWFRNFKESLFPKLLSYLLQSKLGQHKLESIMIGSAQKALTIIGLKGVSLNLPPLPEQKAIAHVLGTLDDRIELNRRMNETLEAMAQALFKSWFVDFDPVIDNALAGGKEIPAELSKKAQARAALGDKRQPLPEEIRTLFPDEFTYSDELGWIPEGWEVKQVGELLELAYGKSLPAKKREAGPYPVYGSGGIGGFHNKAIVEGPGIIVGRKGTVGSVFLEPGEFFPIDTVFFVTPKIDMPLYWIYQNLQNMDIASLGADSAVPGVNRNAVYIKEWVLPDRSVLAEYWNQLSTPLLKRKSLDREIETLVFLRDTLLPKLLSGEIRIPDAEKMVEELAL